MSAVFADTFYWIALISPGDAHSREVRRFDHLLSGGNVFTTEEVPAEVHIVPKAMNRFCQGSIFTPPAPTRATA